MVEDFWRTAIPLMQAGGGQPVIEAGQRFEARINETAAFLPPVESAAFLQTIEAERESIITQYNADPVALKRRLGVPLGNDAPFQTPMRSERMGLGEMAVRTAVRATIWDTIWSLFRAAR